jgi:hypothetical protein
VGAGEVSDLVERTNVEVSDLVERTNVEVSDLVERSNVTDWFTVPRMVDR